MFYQLVQLPSGEWVKATDIQRIKMCYYPHKGIRIVIDGEDFDTPMKDATVEEIQATINRFAEKVNSCLIPALQPALDIDRMMEI